MKRPRTLPVQLLQTVIAFWATAIPATVGLAQGTITFNGWAGLSSTHYEEQGLRFQVVLPQGTTGEDDMAIISSGYQNHPQNTSSYMLWYRQFNPYDYVSLSTTNGSSFGFSSVWLADPTAPSPSPVTISFIGYLAGGSTITNTFTTPGNGATTFASYTFSPAFASGLTSVDILAPRWAMDNLAFTIPEPGAAALALVSLLAFALRKVQPSSTHSPPAGPEP